jgi:hypothetical protein
VPFIFIGFPRMILLREMVNSEFVCTRYKRLHDAFRSS